MEKPTLTAERVHEFKTDAPPIPATEYVALGKEEQVSAIVDAITAQGFHDVLDASGSRTILSQAGKSLAKDLYGTYLHGRSYYEQKDIIKTLRQADINDEYKKVVDRLASSLSMQTENQRKNSIIEELHHNEQWQEFITHVGDNNRRKTERKIADTLAKQRARIVESVTAGTATDIGKEQIEQTIRQQEQQAVTYNNTQFSKMEGEGVATGTLDPEYQIKSLYGTNVAVDNRGKITVDTSRFEKHLREQIPQIQPHHTAEQPNPSTEQPEQVHDIDQFKRIQAEKELHEIRGMLRRHELDRKQHPLRKEQETLPEAPREKRPVVIKPLKTRHPEVPAVVQEPVPPIAEVPLASQQSATTTETVVPALSEKKKRPWWRAAYKYGALPLAMITAYFGISRGAYANQSQAAEYNGNQRQGIVEPGHMGSQDFLQELQRSTEASSTTTEQPVATPVPDILQPEVSEVKDTGTVGNVSVSESGEEAQPEITPQQPEDEPGEVKQETSEESTKIHLDEAGGKLIVNGREYDYEARNVEGPNNESLLEPYAAVIHFTTAPVNDEFQINYLSGNNPEQKTVQYIIGNDQEGRIYKVLADVDGKLRVAGHEGGSNPLAVGIEIVAPDGNGITPKQLEATAALLQLLQEKYGIRYVVSHENAEHQITQWLNEKQISPDAEGIMRIKDAIGDLDIHNKHSGKSDPGQQNMQALFDMLQQAGSPLQFNEHDIPQLGNSGVSETSAANPESEMTWRTASEAERYMWRIVDSNHRLPDTFKAEVANLQENGIPTTRGEIAAHPLVIRDMQELMAAAKAANISLLVGSAERDIAYQQGIYKGHAAQAEPGTSQHHTGLAIDFTTSSIDYRIDTAAGFENTQEGRFLQENAWRFGFVQSYVDHDHNGVAHDGKPEESWHYYYVGKDLAKVEQELRNKGWKGDVFDLMQYFERNNYSVPVDHNGNIAITPEMLQQ